MTRNVIAAIGVAAPLTGAACHQAPPTVPQPPSPAQTLPDSLRWVRDSAEYRAVGAKYFILPNPMCGSWQ
jgi:hypothetical protein